jgi:hypothetical protein
VQSSKAVEPSTVQRSPRTMTCDPA